MEVKIVNNNTKQYSRAVVFGVRSINKIYQPSSIPLFLDIKTDEGVVITYDGHEIDNYEDYMKKFKDPFEIDSIEYFSNNTKLNGFYLLQEDANGKKLLSFVPINIQTHLKPEQENIFPIVIKDNDMKMDINTSFLFTLKPLEGITLKIKTK